MIDSKTSLPEASHLKSAVNQFFSGPIINRMLASQADSFRKRLLNIEIVLLTLLHFILTKQRSFLRLVDELRLGRVPGVESISVTGSAFYKRLRAIPHTVFLDLLREVTRSLNATRKHYRDKIRELAPFANGIYAIDDTTLDKLIRKTKTLKDLPKGHMDTLAGRLGCALDLSTGCFAEVLYDSDSAANEKNHIRPLIERLGAGNLFVFDLGYFAFPFFDYLTKNYSYFISRLRAKTSYKTLQTLTQRPLYREHLIYLGQHRADRAKYPVRLLELKIGGVWYQYITNVLDPKMLPAHHVWALYAQRWTIEKSFAVLKRVLGMAFLHPCHQNGMLIQVWCTLCVYQVMQDLRLEIASANGWDEDEISWSNLMHRIASYASYPQPNAPELRSWLVNEAKNLYLQKRGTRKRRPDSLPDELLRSCRQPPKPIDPRTIETSNPRQGCQEQREKDSLVIMGALS